MQHILYNTADATYPGDIRDMAAIEAEAANASERDVDSTLRWIPLSCDICDGTIGVSLISGTQAVCNRCMR